MSNNIYVVAQWEQRGEVVSEAGERTVGRAL